MTDHDRITHLVHRAAEQAAPQPTDLWPRIAARLGSRTIAPPAPQQRRWTGSFVAAALIVSVLVVGAILITRLNDNGGVYLAPLAAQGTPTASPQVITATPTLISQPTSVPTVIGTPTPISQPVFVVTSTPIPVDGAPGLPTPFHTIVSPADLVPSLVPPVSDITQVDATFTPLPPTATPPEGISAVEALYTQYYSRALDLTFTVPAAWIPYDDPALNRDDIGVTAHSFYADARDVVSLAERAPQAGPALVLVRSTDAAAGGYEPLRDTSAAFRALADVVGITLPIEFDQTRLFTTGSGLSSEPYTFYLLIAPPGESTNAYREVFDRLLESVGVRLFDTTYIAPADFTDGTYAQRAQLTIESPRRVYMIEAPQIPPDTLAADGWVLAQVAGDYRTPLLHIDYANSSYTAVTGYKSPAGAILFPIPVDAAQRDDYFVHINVDGSSTYTFGGYTLSLRPAQDVTDISEQPQTITVSEGKPVVLRFDLPDTREAQLRIETVQAMSFEEAASSRILPPVTINVLLPYGESLVQFEPRRSQSVQVAFMPPMRGQQYIVLNPVDLCLSHMSTEQCAEYRRSDITLSISIDTVSATVTE